MGGPRETQEIPRWGPRSPRERPRLSPGRAPEGPGAAQERPKGPGGAQESPKWFPGRENQRFDKVFAPPDLKNVGLAESFKRKV